MKNILSEFIIKDMLLQYIQSDNQTVGMVLLPLHRKEQQKTTKEYEVDSLIQLKLEGDDFPFGFANGHTLLNSQTTYGMKYQEQRVIKTETGLNIITVIANDKKLRAEHILIYDKDYPVIEVKVKLCNEGSETVSVEMLSSFSLCGITPFLEGEAPETMLIHRMRSKWSAEGRMETRTAEELLLEPSWSRYAAYSEKFGQVGSMPVRKYFPFAAVEDKENKVVWAASLGCASSWQMEIYRRDNGLSLTGGLADYDFGHWRKFLKPEELFETPSAYLTVFNGSVDETCQRLVSRQKKPLGLNRKWDRLPVIFNEFCTTWGKPSHENISKILHCIKSCDIDYFVIDAGWYADVEKGWEKNVGDWIISRELFPEGIEPLVSEIKKAGIKPGIWFELEVCARDSKAFFMEDHLLKRHGKTITVGDRRFWDMRDPWTTGYLTKKVIVFLNHYGFEYLKVDYNDSIGVGCDGAESLGEGLRQNIVAAQKFYQEIKDKVPGIAIEVCSSGGHRLEPSMMALADLASFSDAHEEKEIPIIAANLHRAILPEQSQIWAVARSKDSKQRLIYSMANTFLGVMCLSGDIYDLDGEQWDIINEGISFYRGISGIIQDGFTEIYGPGITSYRFPKGWQAVVRYSGDKKEAFVIVHSFRLEKTTEIVLNLKGSCQIHRVYEAFSHGIKVEKNQLTITMSNEYDAAAIHLIF
ncbi:alpha-galactosidase [Anaerocolumna sp. AGMB13025]|uniref:alpha-galactosidase n=1 Tax=Anaerocolumna sp. AGMB13025 TaxID=3039116 RepID=UPI00241BF6B3|nr:alpha-galactosidase [Anaerocolumna sp. AGMB13025]WFR58638.1 alpha-galactosidase [Anaerocolumna sp. AGMB13025]